MTKQNKNRKKHVAIGAAVVCGLTLIVGATFNLPAGAQGLVTGRNVIVIEQLADQVGPGALVQASIDEGLLPANSLEENLQVEQRDGDDRRGARRDRRENERSDRDGRRQQRQARNGEGENGQERNEGRRNPGQRQVNDEIIDRLERIGPETVVQAAVDAGLITNAEAERLLAQ